MISDWETKKFGDCAFLVKEIINPTEAPSTYYVGLEHIGESSLSLLSFGESESVESSKYKFKKGDILFGKLRPYFRKVVIAPFDGICSTDIWVVRAKDGIDQNFLFYWMASNKFVDAASRGSEGTRMPRAKWDFVSQLEELIPSYKEQKCIANLLSSLSKKIEHNNCQNEMLDKIARAIFKSWFIDFDPVRAKAEGKQPFGMDEETAALFPSEFEDSELGEIPKGWKIGPFTDTINILSGGTPKTSVAEYWGGNIPWYSVVDAPREGDVFTITTEKTITQAGVDESATKILPELTTIISARGTVGKLALTGVPMAMNQSCYGLVPVSEFGHYFTYFNTKHIVEELRQNCHGSVFDTITRQTFSSIEVVIPPESIIKRYEQIVSPLLDLIRNNLYTSSTLAEIRDTLLPKLLSGEIRVPMEAD